MPRSTTTPAKTGIDLPVAARTRYPPLDATCRIPNTTSDQKSPHRFTQTPPTTAPMIVMVNPSSWRIVPISAISKPISCLRKGMVILLPSRSGKRNSSATKNTIATRFPSERQNEMNGWKTAAARVSGLRSCDGSGASNAPPMPRSIVLPPTAIAKRHASARATGSPTGPNSNAILACNMSTAAPIETKATR